MQTSTLASPTKGRWSMQTGSPSFMLCATSVSLKTDLGKEAVCKGNEGCSKASLLLRSTRQAAACRLAGCQTEVPSLPAPLAPAV